MSGDVGAEVAAVLAAHALVTYTGTGLVHCRCDSDARTPLTTRKKHAAHVADALAPLIAVRVEAAKAEALREAAADVCICEDWSDVPGRHCHDCPAIPHLTRAAALDSAATLTPIRIYESPEKPPRKGSTP